MTGRIWRFATSTAVAGVALAGAGSARALPDDTTTTTATTTTAATTTTTTSTSTTSPPVACTVLSAEVDGGTATFTVGPDGCTVQVGPISFSTYDLPSGWRQPYAGQVLIEHAFGNGSSYGAGTYVLTASLGDSCNWQSDLYRAPSDDQPPLIRLISYDYVEGRVCESPTTTAGPTTTSQAPTTTAAPTTTVATSSTSEVSETTTTTTTTLPATGPTGPDTTSAPTTAVGGAGGTVTTVDVRSEVPTTFVSGAPAERGTTTTAAPAVSPLRGSLPSTGAPLVAGLLTVGLGAVLLGALLRRMAGSPPR